MFSLVSVKFYIVASHQNRLDEAILIDELKKMLQIYSKFSLQSGAMVYYEHRN